MTVAFEEQTKHYEEFNNEQRAGKGAMPKPLAIIEKWEVVQSISQRFEAFETGTCLRGYVLAARILAVQSSSTLPHRERQFGTGISRDPQYDISTRRSQRGIQIMERCRQDSLT